MAPLKPGARNLTTLLIAVASAALVISSYGCDWLPMFQIDSAVSADQPGTATLHVKANADWRGTVTIRDEQGRLVRILYYVPHETHPANETQTFAWDLADQRGKLLPAGRYAIRVEAVRVPHVNSPRDIYTFVPTARLDFMEEAVWTGGHLNMFVPNAIGHHEESVIRKLDFDGYPMSDEVPLDHVNLCPMQNHFEVDIHDQIYVCTGGTVQDKFNPNLICRFDGKTGKRVWANVLSTMEERYGGENKDTFMSGPISLLDTGDEIYMCEGESGDGKQGAFDAATGALLRQLDLDREGIPVFEQKHPACPPKPMWDGGFLIEWPAYTKFGLDGRILWCGIAHTDLNGNGTVIDVPVSPRLRELHDFGASENRACHIDVTGSVYFQVAPAHPHWPRIVEGPDHPANLSGWQTAHSQGVGKVDEMGQLCLAAELELGSLMGVSADGKLLVMVGQVQGPGNTHPMLVYQADRSECRVRISDKGGAIPDNRAEADEELFERHLAGAAHGDFRDDFNRGRLLYALNRNASSARFFAAVLKATKDADYRLGSYLYLARNACRTGDYGQAVDCLGRLAKDLPAEAGRAHIRMAACYRAAGEFEKAMEACTAAVRQAKDGYWRNKARLARGETMAAAGGGDEARALYQELAETEPLVASEALLRIARLREREGRWNEAAAVYARVASEYFSRRYWTMNHDLPRCYRNGAAKIDVPPLHRKGLEVRPAMLLGQRSFAQFGDGCISGFSKATAVDFNNPLGVFSHGSTLYVADLWHSRVMVFNDTAGLRNYQPADLCLGLPSFEDYSLCFFHQIVKDGRRSQRELHPVTGEDLNAYWAEHGDDPSLKISFTVYPAAICSDGQRIYVSDQRWNRVLIFARSPAEMDPLPDVVLGQPDLLSFAEGPLPPSAETMRHPFGIHCDGRKLFVADRGNNRVLIWNDLPQKHGEPASVVLGQADFAGNERNAGGLSARSLNRPGWVFSTGAKLIVSDTMNDRVLIWNRIPEKNFAPAQVVLGQRDFTSALGWNFLGTGSTSLQEFSCPNGLLVDEKGRLYLADSYNNRILIWNRIPERNDVEPDHVLGDINTALSAKGLGVPGAYSPEPRVRGHFFTDIAADKDWFYISDFHPCRVVLIARQELEKAMR